MSSLTEFDKPPLPIESQNANPDPADDTDKTMKALVYKSKRHVEVGKLALNDHEARQWRTDADGGGLM